VARVNGVVLLLALAMRTAAQNADRPPSVTGPRPEPFGWLTAPYKTRSVNSVDSKNTPRIYELLRAGNIYLSLSDAIALAIENNLSVQSARYQLEIADTDVLRARGGGTLRGVGIVSFDLPGGVGGPASPLITGAATGAPPSTAVPTDIFDLGFLQGTTTSLSPDPSLTSVPLPTAAGPPVPQFDPVLTGALLWQKQETPQNSTFTTGTDNLVTRSLMANLGLQQGFSTGTNYALTYTSTWQDTNSVKNGYNPSTSGNLGLTVTQPLLRGFGTAINRRWIRIAKNDRKISDLVFRQDLMNLVYGVRAVSYKI
jgi:outer membrane protein